MTDKSSYVITHTEMKRLKILAKSIKDTYLQDDYKFRELDYLKISRQDLQCIYDTIIGVTE